MSSLKGMQHVAIEASDIERSITFYRDFLGLKVTERHEAYEIEAIPVELVFMRIGNRHHDIVLVNSPEKNYRARTPDDMRAGPVYFHHLAFECEDRDAWLKMLEKAKEMGVEIVRGPVVHSPWDPRGDGSWGELESFYVLDPDGHRIEFFCDMATILPDGTFKTAAGERIEQAKAVE